MKANKLLWLACLIGICSLFGCSSDSGGDSNPDTSEPGVCGDGTKNEDEACDDGNTQAGDGCSASCTIESGYECTGNACTLKPSDENCGNGVLDENEVCDDGNQSSDDGCLANCLGVVPGWTCPSEGGACTKDEKPNDEPTQPEVVCGDGVIDGEEQCDDGNLFKFDGCSKLCQIEEGWLCPTPGEPCERIIIDYCANGTLEEDKGETCDDGNKEDGDGCSQYCLLEKGYTCEGNVCKTTCGDRIIAGTEVCDDGNNSDGDGCKADCSAQEEGFDCIEVNRMTYCKSQTCGDRSVNKNLNEECDYGPDSAADSSPSYGWSTEYNAPHCYFCKLTPYCGDGIITGDEQCDEGILPDGSQRLDEAGKPVGGSGEYGTCNPDCTLAERCGDGTINGTEQCDSGTDENGVSLNVGGYKGCKADCSGLEMFCGDGVVDTYWGEFCDSGIVIAGALYGGTGAYGDCMQDCSAHAGFCGDGIIQPEEICDLGSDPITEVSFNIGGYNGCAADCMSRGSHCGDGIVDKENGELCDEAAVNSSNMPIGGLGLYDTCKADCSGLAGYCGDGIKQPEEACDDGINDGSYNGCMPGCSAVAPFCGDSHVDTAFGEICDEGSHGNKGLYNGCGTDCKARGPYCGDGIVNGNEVCDKGAANTDSGAYGTCSKSCTWGPICGDGIKNGSEACDEGRLAGNRPVIVDSSGNPIGGYGNYSGCNSNCTLAPYCGDGKKDAPEACDDKNTKSGDGCSNKCAVEQGYECRTPGSACTRLPCGNGKHDTGEQCDDGNFVAGDGCYNCRAEAGIMCTYGTPACPDRYCKNLSKECNRISLLYGDSILDKGFEQCDDGNTTSGDGCSSTGQIEPGYICPTVGKRCVAATCGDGIIAYGEDCDDGNAKAGDGCSDRCRMETGYACPTPGKACTGPGKCGDGVVHHGEGCDDGNKTSGDGCSSTCQIEQGYVCLAAGGSCLPTSCGDSKLNAVPGGGRYNGYEECDLGANNGKTNSGCTSACKISTGYHCNAAGTSCSKGTNGDGYLDKGEECDDGNIIGGDGCNPKGKVETVFECYNNECKSLCGDGITLWMVCKMDAVGNCLCKDGSNPATSNCTIANGKAVPAEECDDGNLTSGDGCSSQCEIEDGFNCTAYGGSNPTTIDLPATFRDFREYDQKGTGEGYLTSASVSAMSSVDSYCSSKSGNKPTASSGHPDFGCSYGGSGCKGMVQTYLDADKKPQLVSNWKSVKCSSGTASNSSAYVNSNLSCSGSFYYWYRDLSPINKRYNGSLRLTRDATDMDKYVFDSDNPKTAVYYNGTKMSSGYYQPLYNVGWKTTDNNYGAFTTEISLYFQYKGGETLAFTGDDDVWVFINDMLFVDLGGMRSKSGDQNTLATTKYQSTNRNYDARYEVYEGGIYEMKLFNAERCASGSNFKLTLDGFLNTGKSTCTSICGDGIVAGSEECDPGNVADDVAVMMGCPKAGANACKKVPYCGNGIIEAGEVCDYGADCKTTPQPGCTYKPSEDGRGCDAKCQNTTCGNGKLESWEDCDCKNGSCLPGGTKPASCMQNCMFVTCGDGIKAGSEECDLGASNGASGANCTNKCTIPRCGDGIVQAHLGEVCDLGDGNNTGAYGKCSTDCSFKPAYCGDGIIQTENGEVCDNGIANADGLYNGCTTKCQLGPYCGDGTRTAAYEACDKGKANNNGAYGAGNCNADCTLAAYCGDGIKNGSEACDYGGLNDDAAYNGCTSSCQIGAYCGDGIQNGAEACDKGTANNTGVYGPGNCNADCTAASYCGDGIIDLAKGEVCDNGANNDDSAYGGCSSSCQRNAYCGDGIINGPETCDNGKDDAGKSLNVGGYGETACNPNCARAAYCGDGRVQTAEGEECDQGIQNNADGAYGTCSTTCKRNSYCGDGIVDESEECDNGKDPETGLSLNVGGYGPEACSLQCKRSGYCGDGIRQAVHEYCDNGPENNDEVYEGCNTSCKRGPHCGDGIVNGTEECDGTDNCTKTCTLKVN